MRALTDPRIDGYENLPADGRYLLVGNHTTLGLFDVPFLVLGIHERTGILVRSLGERQHFRVPLWREMLAHFGTINGTRENTRRLLRAGHPQAGDTGPAIRLIGALARLRTQAWRRLPLCRSQHIRSSRSVERRCVG